MSVWNGWQTDLLSHAGIPDTAANRQFLSDWHSHAETNCNNNPVDLTVQSAGATNCHALPAVNAHSQNYATTGDAVHAFDTQIHQSGYSHLLAVLMTGSPYTASGSGLASQDITRWGSQAFAQFYFGQTATAPGRGGGTGPVPTQSLRGWKDVRKSVNKHMKDSLVHSDRQMVRALHSLARARKVKL